MSHFDARKGDLAIKVLVSVSTLKLLPLFISVERGLLGRSLRGGTVNKLALITEVTRPMGAVALLSSHVSAKVRLYNIIDLNLASGIYDYRRNSSATGSQ